MSGTAPARPAGLRRRARAWLFAGGIAFAAIAAAMVWLRPEPEPYTPGAEAARGEEITSRLARDLPPDAPRARFVEAAEGAGIRFRHFSGTRSAQLPEDMGSGAAWGDYDGDGDPDLYLVNESGPLDGGAGPGAGPPGGAAGDAAAGRDGGARSALYRNEGDGTFTDVTARAGVGAGGLGMGAAWGDHDGDGDLDLVVTRYGTNLLYRNDDGGAFTEVSATVGLGGVKGFWTGASWADYDRDGDLDLYACGYVQYAYDEVAGQKKSLQFQSVVPYTLNPSSYPPERNLLYRNDGGRFTEVARAAGVDNPAGRSLSATWADFDADGWVDLYVANDVSDNAMFRNRGDGRFDDVSHSAWVADYRGAMGLAVGDWDGDDDLDIFVTHWIAQENALFENQHGTIPARPGEPMHFMDNADVHGLGQISLDDIGWGTGFFDYDNDGRLDIFVANGSTFQVADDPARLIPMRNRLFWNGGRDRGFFNLGEAGGEPFTVENVGRGAAFADYDGDGDIDVAVVVNGGAARLLRNDGGNAGSWLRVVLRGPAAARSSRASAGRGPRGARATPAFAEGAAVRVTAAGATQVRVVGGSSSYLSQSPPGEVHFGLGGAERIDRLEVAWPDGSKQSFEDLTVNTTIRIVQGEGPVAGTRSAGGTGRAGAGEGRSTLSKDEVVRFWRTFNEATGLRLRDGCAASIEVYEKALGIDPRHEDSLYYLGQCLRDVGRHGEARETFDRLVTINPSSNRGHVALAALLSSPDDGAPLDLAAAERHLRRAHAINAEETGPLVRLGEVLLARGEAGAALRHLEHALSTNPKSVEAAFLIGYLRWEAGDLDGARDYCARARRAAQAEAPTHGVLGEGDRRASGTGAAARAAAPPLRSPMGETLFNAFAAPLRTPAAGAESSLTAHDLDALYDPVRALRARLAARGARP